MVFVVDLIWKKNSYSNMLYFVLLSGFSLFGKLQDSFVRLNLFNHVLALFRVKFACNLAIRYPVFR